ncbi:hypothetical protein LTR62_002572 [Meristemomyces frigidus]|uniref:Zn(2)-C6 fungal-type domain-containing protein n=1 Tax=Meristemomyces frigidus TaxID=1508187 RepID=A0AAN7YQ48_9PEZI|nr:hypothetical protein LTR62_002572 [Meristemomyces frigidus]
MPSQHKPPRIHTSNSAFASLNLSPSLASPNSRMADPMRSISHDSTDSIRKRVFKACDRCRLKKSKCDGNSPCSRCQADNTICVFGERKKSQDKVYPRGYVEMLEQQQSQLVAALRITYQKLGSAGAWPGPTLPEVNGYPLTHDILAALDLLESKQDGTGEPEMFEEDCDRLKSRLLAGGAGFVPRRGSLSSDSEHDRPHLHDSPKPLRQPKPMFRESFAFNKSTLTTPRIRSPALPVKTAVPAAQPSPLQQSSPLRNDPQFYQAEWSIPDMSTPEAMMRSHFLSKQNQLDQDVSMGGGAYDPSYLDYDGSFDCFPPANFQHQYTGAYGSTLFGMGDFLNEPVDMDTTASVIQVAT